MSENTDAQIRHIYDRWHETVVGRDLDGLVALYAEDAILETPLIPVALMDRTQGILKRRRSAGRPSKESASAKVSDEELADVRAAGFTDADVVAIAGLTAQFLFTNFMNNIAQIELDF